MGHYGHKHELIDLSLSHFSKTGIILDACETPCIGHSTFYRCLGNDRDFEEKVIGAHQTAYKVSGRLLDAVPPHKRHTLFLNMINDNIDGK